MANRNICYAIQFITYVSLINVTNYQQILLCGSIHGLTHKTATTDEQQQRQIFDLFISGVFFLFNIISEAKKSLFVCLFVCGPHLLRNDPSPFFSVETRVLSFLLVDQFYPIVSLFWLCDLLIGHTTLER